MSNQTSTVSSNEIPQAELGEQELEAVAGGLTPVAIPTWAVVTAGVGVLAGAAATILGAINNIEERMLNGN